MKENNMIQISQLVFIFASQLSLIFPLRNEEVFPQRLVAEGAISVHQLPPDNGGTHKSLQCDAQVRS